MWDYEERRKFQKVKLQPKLETFRVLPCQVFTMLFVYCFIRAFVYEMRVFSPKVEEFSGVRIFFKISLLIVFFCFQIQRRGEVICLLVRMLAHA